MDLTYLATLHPGNRYQEISSTKLWLTTEETACAIVRPRKFGFERLYWRTRKPLAIRVDATRAIGRSNYVTPTTDVASQGYTKLLESLVFHFAYLSGVVLPIV